MPPSTPFSARSRNVILVTADGTPRSKRARINLRRALSNSPVALDPVFEVAGLLCPGFVLRNGLVSTPALLDHRPSDSPRVLYGELADIKSVIQFLRRHRLRLLTTVQFLGWYPGIAL